MCIAVHNMRLGHGPAGAVGLATDWNQIATWAPSFATCGELAHDVTKTNDGKREVIHTHYKEESQARIQNYNDDRCIIRSTLTMCVDPLNDASHPDGALINIITGEVYPLHRM